MFAIHGIVARSERRKEVAFLDPMDLGHGLARDAYHLAVLGSHPDQPVEESLTVQDLSRTQMQRVAFHAVNQLESLVANLVEPQRLERQHEWIDFPNISKILFRHPQATELDDGRRAESLVSAAFWREGDVTHLLVATGQPTLVNLVEFDRLRVGIVAALFHQLGAQLGDPPDETIGQLRNGRGNARCQQG